MEVQLAGVIWQWSPLVAVEWRLSHDKFGHQAVPPLGLPEAWQREWHIQKPLGIESYKKHQEIVTTCWNATNIIFAINDCQTSWFHDLFAKLLKKLLMAFFPRLPRYQIHPSLSGSLLGLRTVPRSTKVDPPLNGISIASWLQLSWPLAASPPPNGELLSNGQLLLVK